MTTPHVPFDPMAGCPQCKWLDTNLGRVLDKKCDLHERIEDLQADLVIANSVNRSSARMITDICEALGADCDDDPVRVAKDRMEEIRELEDELHAIEQKASVESFEAVLAAPVSP